MWEMYNRSPVHAMPSMKQSRIKLRSIQKETALYHYRTGISR